jgi:TorA maturation chaperone TorD
MALRPDRPHDADDHVGLELLFMALMDERAADGDQVAETARQRFLQEHLQQWIPSFCRDVETAAVTDFWRGVARLTAGILAQEG